MITENVVIAEPKIRRYWRQWRLLTVIQLLEMRPYALVTLIFSLVMPLAMVFGLGSMGSGQSAAGLTYIVSGSLVFSLVTLGIVSLSQEMATMKTMGVFLYYASLPISKTSLLLAVLLTRLLFQLPGMLVILIASNWMYHLHFQFSPFILLVIILAVLSLSGVGGALGLALPVQVVPIVASVVLFGVLFAAPVLIPLERLPIFLQWLGWLLPPTYAADALRRSLFGISDARFWLDLTVLAFYAIVSSWLVIRHIRWQLS